MSFRGGVLLQAITELGLLGTAARFSSHAKNAQCKRDAICHRKLTPAEWYLPRKRQQRLSAVELPLLFLVAALRAMCSA